MKGKAEVTGSSRPTLALPGDCTQDWRTSGNTQEEGCEDRGPSAGATTPRRKTLPHGPQRHLHTQLPLKMAEQKDVGSSSPMRTPSLKLTAEQPLTGEYWIPPKKKILQVQGQRQSPSKMVGGAKIAFRIKPHTHQRCSEGSNKTLCTPGPRDPTDTEPDLPLRV